MRLTLVTLLWTAASSFGVHSSFSNEGRRQRRPVAFQSHRNRGLSATISADVVSTENLALLSPRGRAAVENLIAFDASEGHQAHVYKNWPAAGEDDHGKKQLAEQVREEVFHERVLMYIQTSREMKLNAFSLSLSVYIFFFLARRFRCLVSGWTECLFDQIQKTVTRISRWCESV